MHVDIVADFSQPIAAAQSQEYEGNVHFVFDNTNTFEGVLQVLLVLAHNINTITC